MNHDSSIQSNMIQFLWIFMYQIIINSFRLKKIPLIFLSKSYSLPWIFCEASEVI